MDVLVLFGSKSDAYIYEPLKSALIAEGYNVNFRIFSVHRRPDALSQELEQVSENIVVAGAGLAAHLPGVVASKVLMPVIGIPFTSALGGMDALLAMIQMPFGIPVLCTAPDNFKAAIGFLDNVNKLSLCYSGAPLYVVIERNKESLPYVTHILKRLEQLAQKAEAEWKLVYEPVVGAVNICLNPVDLRDAAAPPPFVAPMEPSILIHVPLVEENAYCDPQTGLALLQKLRHGGVWVGLNNVGNGFLAALQMANQNGRFSPVLTNVKKGYIHG